jgi:hypothetical protein
LLHCLVEGLFFMRVHDPIGRRSRILQWDRGVSSGRLFPRRSIVLYLVMVGKKRFSYVNIDVTSSYIQYLLGVTGKLKEKNSLQNLLLKFLENDLKSQIN